MTLNIDFEYDSKRDGFVYTIKDKLSGKELAKSTDAFESPREAMRTCLMRLNSAGISNIPQEKIENSVLIYRDTKWV